MELGKKEREMGGMEKILLSNFSANNSKITGMGGFPLILTLELFVKKFEKSFQNYFSFILKMFSNF